MIKEISNFIKYLEDSSPQIFFENLELKEGVYIFLEEIDGQLQILKENILVVNKSTDKNTPLYQKFLQRYLVSEMLTNKTMNASEKIYIAIGSPFGISFSGKGYKTGIEKRKQAMEAYFKAVEKYLDINLEQHTVWFNQFKDYAQNRLFQDIATEYKDYTLQDENKTLEYSESKFYDSQERKVSIDLTKEIKGFQADSQVSFNENTKNITYYDKQGNEKWQSVDNLILAPKVKDGFMFFFYLKEPEIDDYKVFYEAYLSKKVFLNDLKKGETHGLSNDLTVGNVSKKPFMQHKTAPFDVNFRVDEATAKHLYKFFRLQQKNKLLPNPMPIFVDSDELPLSQKAITIFNDDRKSGHREIIETLLKDKKKDLQNFYLIYFQGGLKGSKIIDLDFIPVFRYDTSDMPRVKPFFNTKAGLFEYSIKNIFEFQEKLMNKVLNKQLVQGGRLKYFDELKVNPKYGATATIIELLYRYRKSIYDYIYKSKRQAITATMFHDIMWNSILDDVRHDEKLEKTKRIKEKLNIWFSFYNYFNHKKNDNMPSKIPELWERCRAIANSDAEHLSDNPKEFAFAMGQIIYFLLTKSVAANKKHAMLEPFLQKTTAEQLQVAVSNLIGTYKHELDFGQGRFERLAREVLAYETTENMKKLQRYILAGYFAQPVIFEKKEHSETTQN